ncbi:MAG: bifunctional UDP-sugar hydrolase/5'-nucleotidase [Bacteroidota bacterium]
MRTHITKSFLLAGCLSLLFVLPLASQTKSITILHTNDIHATFIPREATWMRETPKPLVGGINELSFALDSVRKINNATLYLDAGDIMTGNPITEYEYHGALGGALFQMMNMIGCDAWCLGNHDFDLGQKNLLQLTRIAKFPTVSANVVDDNGNYPLNNKPYVIIEKNGLKIGIIGVMSQGLYGLVNQTMLVGIKVLSPIATTQKFIDELQPKTDLIVALTHQGVDDDSVLAMNVHGLNVIVGGHSHTRLKQPKLINGVIIVQTGAYCENLGVLDLTVDNKKVTQYNGKLIQLWYDSARPKTELSAFIDSVQHGIEKDYSQVIGTLKEDWVRNDNGESGIGDFISDAQREAAHADVGFMNNTGIRKNLSAGPITKRDIFEILPFRNILTTFQLSGSDVKTIVLNYIQQHLKIQTSGIQCEWKSNPDGKIEIVKLEINGKPFDEKGTYIGAASDFYVGEAKHYLGIEILHPVYLQQTVFETIETKVRNEKEVDSKVENRIKEIK